jgi:1,4-dihydroxy-2-naphthoate octaprenyltransferase
LVILALLAYAATTVLSRARAWIQASRPLAQVNIAVPLVLGAILALPLTGGLNWRLLGWTLAFGILDQLFIVYLNDVADEPGDRANETHTPFSGGSRVLVESKLEAAALRRAGAAMAGGMLGVAVYLAVGADRLAMLPAWGLAVALLWAYSFPPIRAAYRGGGEVLQGLGVGVVLPAVGFYVQTGSLADLPWLALAPTFLLGWAGNVTTALPDAPADAMVDKRSYPVRVGSLAARRHSVQVIAIAILFTPLVLPNASRLTLALVEAPPLLALLLSIVSLRKAVPDAPGPMRRFIVGNGLAANLAMVSWMVALVVG